MTQLLYSSISYTRISRNDTWTTFKNAVITIYLRVFIVKSASIA